MTVKETLHTIIFAITFKFAGDKPFLKKQGMLQKLKATTIIRKTLQTD